MSGEVEGLKRSKISQQWNEDARVVGQTLSERHALARLIAVRILYAMLAGLVFTPITAWMVQWLTKSGGSSVVSNFDLATFFLSFRGLLFLALSGTFALAVFFFEQSGMILVARSALSGGRLPKLMEVIWLQKKQFPRLLRLGLFYFLAAVVVALPVLIVGGICFFTMLSDRDINYYLSVKPPVFWKAITITSLGAIVTAAGLLWMYLRWFLALPILLFEGTGVRESIRRSRERTAGRVWLFGVEMLALSALGFLLVLVMTLVLKGIDKLFFEVYANQIQMVVIGGALLLITHFIITTAITFLGFSAQGILISQHYLRSASVDAEPIDLAESDRHFGFFGMHSARSVVWTVLVVGLVVSLFAAWSMVEEVKIERIVEVTAHRGSSVEAPENTLSALRLAMEEQADYAEIDIQISGDGELVMIHDSELMRVSGLNLKVADMTREQRLKLDVGKWFSDKFSGEPLPTLDEVIDLVRGKMKLNIELKFGPDREGLNRGVADLIQNKKYQNECVVTSLDYEGLKAFKTLAPEVTTGLIVTSAVGDITRAEADFLSLNAAQVTRSMLSAAE
ncbi:MAG: hypothetical protein GXP30_08410, partial [Verrucomicrobia bacterium]|nr:hypothetical protein [Verrucomicrobiota bacterium]